jgi:MFS family permease
VLLLGGLIPLILSLQLDKQRFPWLPGMGPGADAALWTSWVTVTLFVGAVMILAGFWARAKRARSPILDPALFENKVFRTANASAFFFGATFLSIVIFLPLFLVNVLGVSATRAGVALIPYSLGLVVGSTLAGQLVSRVGHLRDLILVGGFLLLGAVVKLAGMTADVGYWTVTAYMVLAGLGMGPSLPLFTLAIQNAVDVRRLGQATSAAQFFRQIGGTMGAAVMGAVLATTLGLAFAQLELPSFLSAADGVRVDRLASTGGGALPDGIRAGFGELASRVERAVASADTGAIRELAGQGDLPQKVSLELEELLAPGGGEVPSAGMGASLAAQVAQQGDATAERVREEVRQAFAEATHRVYSLAIVLMVLALLLAFRVPEVPLRRTHDRTVVTE